MKKEIIALIKAIEDDKKLALILAFVRKLFVTSGKGFVTPHKGDNAGLFFGQLIHNSFQRVPLFPP